MVLDSPRQVVELVTYESRRAALLYFRPLRMLWQIISAALDAYQRVEMFTVLADHPFLGSGLRAHYPFLSVFHGIDPDTLRRFVQLTERMNSGVLHVGSALIVKSQDDRGWSHVSVTILSEAQLSYLRKNLQRLSEPAAILGALSRVARGDEE